MNDSMSQSHAESWVHDFVSLRDDAIRSQQPEAVSELYRYAVALDREKLWSAAEQVYREAAELATRIVGADAHLTLTILHSLAYLLDSSGKQQEAAQVYEAVLPGMEKLMGKEDPETLDVMNNYACTLDNLGRLNRAEVMHRTTLSRRQKIFGMTGPTLISLNNLGCVLDNKGQYTDAEVIYRNALEMVERMAGENDRRTLTVRNNLGCLLNARGEVDDAEEMHVETLRRRTTAFGQEDPETLQSMNNLAVVFEARGKHDEAESLILDYADHVRSRFAKEKQMDFNTAVTRLFDSGVLRQDVLKQMMEESPDFVFQALECIRDFAAGFEVAKPGSTITHESLAENVTRLVPVKVSNDHWILGRVRHGCPVTLYDPKGSCDSTAGLDRVRIVAGGSFYRSSPVFQQNKGESEVLLLRIALCLVGQSDIFRTLYCTQTLSRKLATSLAFVSTFSACSIQ
ncbi:hypothetical protein O9K51_08562 [Purpureocillium lavendulum]|uniref:Uncharacterized protein n=1 Tax=Purpureocillium lavendulum TaxID=1247861 RepID=A0AB34FJC2_9HYPO|nr:hypothetical protein O9K51_08562 [Purpureocillium lavendulum]